MVCTLITSSLSSMNRQTLLRETNPLQRRVFKYTDWIMRPPDVLRQLPNLRPEKNVPPPSGHTTQKHVLANPWKSETPFATTTIYNGKLRKLSKITGENKLNVCSSLPGFPSGPRPARRVRSSKKPSTRSFFTLPHRWRRRHCCWWCRCRLPCRKQCLQVRSSSYCCCQGHGGAASYNCSTRSLV